MRLATSGTLNAMTGFCSTNFTPRRPEACPEGGSVAAFQLYCMDFSAADHPHSINVFEGMLPVADLAEDLPLFVFMGMAQGVAAAYETDERRRLRIEAVQESEIVGIALSQICGRETEGIVHGTERLASIVLGLDTGVPIKNVEVGRNSSAPWMAAATAPRRNKFSFEDRSILLATMPVTPTEMAASVVQGAVPVYRQERSSFLGLARKPVEYYMGMHRVMTGDFIEPAIEHFISRDELFGLTLGDFLRYSV